MAAKPRWLLISMYFHDLSHGSSCTKTSSPNNIITTGDRALPTDNLSTGSSVTSWLIKSSGGLSPLQSFIFNLTAPGANPARQDAPHPHEALVDPTDSYIFVPDLGADLVRIFSINHNTSELTPSTPLVVPAGSGPRHGSFLVQGNSTYFYLISELGNTIVSYLVHYEESGLGFSKIFSSGTFGPNATVPVNTTSAETIVSVSLIPFVSISPSIYFHSASSRCLKNINNIIKPPLFLPFLACS